MWWKCGVLPAANTYLFSGQYTGCKHRLFTQHCFFFPFPPNFRMSRQHLQEPQSSCVHPEQCPHLFRFLPTVKVMINNKTDAVIYITVHWYFHLMNVENSNVMLLYLYLHHLGNHQGNDLLPKWCQILDEKCLVQHAPFVELHLAVFVQPVKKKMCMSLISVI